MDGFDTRPEEETADGATRGATDEGGKAGGGAAQSGVIVLAATNRADMLDAALLRPGRFDRRVTVDLPDREGREQILRVHAKEKPLREDVDLSALAKRTVGFS